MTKGNVAVIGCGRIARHNCVAIQSAGMRLNAVCDLDENKAYELGQEFGVPTFYSYHDMLKELPNLDLITICTPSGMHFEHAKSVVEEYKKSVVVEKPTFMTLEQLEEAYELATENHVSIYPVFQNRYNKAVRFVRTALDKNELGNIRVVNVTLRWCRPQEYYDLSPWRGTFSHDGGVLTNQGIHHVDLLRYLGGEVSRVHSNLRTMGANIEVEDTAVAIFDFQNGAVGSLEATTAARPDDFEASITITGEKGMARIGGIAVNKLQIYTPDPSACEENSEEFVGIKGRGAIYGYGHSIMYRDIVGDRAGIKPYPISRIECAETISLLHSFYCSDESDRWVRPADRCQSSRLGRPNNDLSESYRPIA